MFALKQPIFFSISLPIKTVSEANSSEHWVKKSKRHKVQRFHIWAAFHNLSSPVPLPCQIHLTRIAPRLLDSDNLQMSMKYIRDSIAKEILGGRLGQNDSDPRIKWEYAQEKGNPKEYAVRIEIFQSHCS